MLVIMLSILCGLVVGWLIYFLLQEKPKQIFKAKQFCHKPPPPPCDNCKKQPTIFVSLASYRDDQCSNTVWELFEKANCPSRIFVGLVQQNNSKEDSDCFSEYCCGPKNRFCRKDQIRIVRIPSQEAKGPTWARYIASKLYQGENYFMQIDSHMRFLKGWDSTAIRMLQDCPANKPVLTHYPLEYNVKSNKNPQQYKTHVPTLCRAEFNKDDMPELRAVSVPKQKFSYECPYISGNFFIAPGTIVDDVPFDPYLPHLFMGEEMLYSARAYCKNYRFYVPTENVAFHYYERKGAPKFWDQIPDYRAIQRRSQERVKYIFGMIPKNKVKHPNETFRELGKYGIADRNMLKEYLTIFDIDVHKKKTSNKYCHLPE